MKKIFVLLILFLLCGCTTTYELKISNNSFKENIDITIPNAIDDYKAVVDPETGVIVERDNQLESIIDSDNSALFSKKSNYKKTVKKFDDYTNVNMKYKYDESKFKDSNVLKTCFDKAEFKSKQNYSISASGYFYCLYSDSLDIKIITNNKVISHNANEVVNNTYIWHITQNNRDNVNIEFVVTKGQSFVFLYGIAILLIVAFIGYRVYKYFIRKNEENNSI